MRGPHPRRIEISVEHLEVVRRHLRRGTTERRVADRARILYFAAQGRPPGEIARGLGCGRNTVWRTTQRYESEGLDAALYDRTRSGRPRQIFPPRPRADSGAGVQSAESPRPAPHPLVGA